MIRALGMNDLEAFIRLREESLRLHPFSFGSPPWVNIDRDKTRFDLAAKHEENFILGYFDEVQNELLGMVGFIRETSIKKRHKGMIWGVYVVPAGKGKGIGKQLMQSLLDRASQLEGLRKINLGVTHLAEAAYYLYRSLGFEEYGRERCANIWEGTEIDEILMTKWL